MGADHLSLDAFMSEAEADAAVAAEQDQPGS
jgi:hypothetical protein